jgi:hypothetical protein
MKIINSLLLLFCASAVLHAQQPKPAAIQRPARCRTCVRPVVRVAPSPASTQVPQASADFFVGEAKVDVTKDETVVRLAMAQHGSVLIELPANDGPRFIIPGDPEMATVDQKALERNKRAIVVRPGTQFVPPLHNAKARTPAATVTAQMRSGLVVTFLFYPVEDLAQNVHRCVLSYNRDEVVARRRAAGLPVNLDTESRGEMAAQSAATISISVENPQDEKRETGPAVSSSPPPLLADAKSESSPKTNASPLVSVQSAPLLDSGKTTDRAKESENITSKNHDALLQAMKKPKQFKHWTKPAHGLALSILSSPAPNDFGLVIVAVKNTASDPLKLTADGPELFLEMIDDQGKPLNIESIKKLHSEPSDTSGVIPRGGVFYYAIAYVPPVLSAHQRIKLAIGQTNAADEPATIVLSNSGR